MVLNKEYEYWCFIQESMAMIDQYGLSHVLNDVMREHEERMQLADPRFYGPDRESE